MGEGVCSRDLVDAGRGAASIKRATKKGDFILKFFRCRTCGFKLVHDGQLHKHVGHSWQNPGNSSVAEDIQILGWYIVKGIKHLWTTTRKLFVS